jgi:20S proteasome alpha/beta subunit
VLKAETTLYQLKKENPIKIKTAGQMLSNVLYQSKKLVINVNVNNSNNTEMYKKK